MKSPTDLTATFRSAGLKITPQRLLLFQLLHDNTAHPSAEVLYEMAAKQMPSISLRTVYQTLNDLATMGELKQIDLGVGPNRFDPYTEDHHHFICDECESIHDVQVDTATPLLPQSEYSDDLHIRKAEVVFRGVCAACATTASK